MSARRPLNLIVTCPKRMSRERRAARLIHRCQREWPQDGGAEPFGWVGPSFNTELHCACRVCGAARSKAGRARKTSVPGCGYYGDVESPQICVMMIFERERALIGSGRVFGDATKHAVGELLAAPLIGHLTIGWSGREP